MFSGSQFKKMKPADVKAVIETEDDFGHEMRVCQILDDAKTWFNPNLYACPKIVSVKHSETYVDPITSKDRQFDFRCQMRFAGELDHMPKWYGVSFAIECKNLHKSSPLVVSGRNRTQKEARHAFVKSTWDTFMGGNFFVQNVDGSRLYPVGAFVGKSLVRLKDDKGKLKTEPQGDLYDKWSQAVISAKEMSREACTFASDNGRASFCSLILPVVVLPDGLLWKVTYDSDGKIRGEPELVDQSEFFIAAQTGVRTGGLTLDLTHIHFCTMTGFRELLRSFLTHPPEKQDVIFPPNKI
jgi:hypothetical protein